jgi:hypothetical protein
MRQHARPPAEARSGALAVVVLCSILQGTAGETPVSAATALRLLARAAVRPRSGRGSEMIAARMTPARAVCARSITTTYVRAATNNEMHDELCNTY